MPEQPRAFTAASFSAYLKEGKLMGVRCRACGHLSAQPRPLCAACHGRDVEWQQFSGRGALSTFTCISVAPAALVKQGFGRNNPYCAGIVTLEEGPRVSARILGVDARSPQSIETGMAVALDLAELDPERPAPAFRPA
ncbi:MAG: Zn-ribbon domain-containing OB-fold protein [Dehalococcoidia bacterium]|nr:Zn-ribbon domain-containing OB-fold protein [Dehalococcoidia bacterium]MSQ16554.1 Zn-ribbon domain-containing OB-fold protein [Dehalococcoidia bacterium]